MKPGGKCADCGRRFDTLAELVRHVCLRLQGGAELVDVEHGAEPSPNFDPDATASPAPRPPHVPPDPDDS